VIGRRQSIEHRYGRATGKLDQVVQILDPHGNGIDVAAEDVGGVVPEGFTGQPGVRDVLKAEAFQYGRGGHNRIDFGWRQIGVTQ
jgi:hypothetical protein